MNEIDKRREKNNDTWWRSICVMFYRSHSLAAATNTHLQDLRANLYDPVDYDGVESCSSSPLLRGKIATLVLVRSTSGCFCACVGKSIKEGRRPHLDRDLYNLFFNSYFILAKISFYRNCGHGRNCALALAASCSSSPMLLSVSISFIHRSPMAR